MRLFKTLAKKLFRDIFTNLRQFLSIIFIIGISVTLYVGLDANAQSFENRVNEVYKVGNVADEWITINPNFTNLEDSKNDLEFIKKEAKVDEGGAVETRFYIPSSIGSTSVSALMMDKLPTINKPYDLEVGYYNDNNFFFVDRALVQRYEDNNAKKLKLGDTLPINFDANYIKQMVRNLASDPDSLVELFNLMLEDTGINENIKTIIDNLVRNYSTEIGNIIIQVVETIFKDDVIEFEASINGIMNHPENLDSGEFSSSNYLISTRLVLTNIIDYVGSQFSSSSIIGAIDSFLETSENQLLNTLLTSVNNYLKEGDNAIQLDAVVLLSINSLTTEIEDRSNAQFEEFMSSFFNQILVKLPSNIKIDDFEDSINRYYQSKEENNLLAALARSNYPSMLSVENDINQAKQLTLVFPIIFFVVALLIVLTTISSLILKDRVQIGTFKALGIKKVHIAFYYLAEMNIVTILGIVIGLIIGPILLPYIMNIKYDILYSIPSLTYLFPWVTALAMTLILVVLVSGLTIALLYSELRLSPSETMRTKSPKISRFKAHKHLIKNTSFMMAIRNIKVHFAKSLMVIIGVMGCTGLLICGMGIDDTINYGKDHDLANFFNSDVTVTLNGSPERGVAKEELLTMNGISEVEEYSTTQITVNSDHGSISTSLYGVETNSKFFGFDDELEDGKREENTVAITQAKAEDLGVGVGDIVTFDVNGKIYKKEVGYIFYAFFVNGVYMYVESEPELFVSSNGAWINLTEGIDPKSVKEYIINNSNYVYSCLTKEDAETRINGYMSSIGTMTNTVKAFAILLAIVVLINLSILNYNERLRELATLKVLGFSRTRIVMSLLIEMLILTIVGAGLGLLIGLPFEYMVLSVNETSLVSWLYLVFPQSYVISFFISLLTALVVNLFMYIKVNRISMSESLKSVDE